MDCQWNNGEDQITYIRTLLGTYCISTTCITIIHMCPMKAKNISSIKY